MKRRDFLKGAAAVMAAAAAPVDGLASALQGGEAPIPRRTLGSTGEKVSILGFPGTAVMSVEPQVASDLVSRAFERGVNFFDVSPSYGNAQQRLGPALAPYRKRCFLASKTDFRDREGATADLERSLEVLETDAFDLYQHHAVERRDLDEIAAPGGAMEAFLAAREAGKVRFLGLSAHSVEVALDAMERLPLDTIMFPVNFVLSTRASFGPQVIQRARAKKLGVLAIKAMARGKYPAAPGTRRVSKCWYDPCALGEEAALAWRWTMSQDIDVNIPSGNPELYSLALELTPRCTPLSREETERLAALTAAADPLFGRASGPG